MGSPADEEGLSVLLTSLVQIIAQLRVISEELAEDPGHRSAGTRVQELLRAFTSCNDPVLEIPSLGLLALLVLLMLLVSVVGTTSKGSEADSKATSDLSGKCRDQLTRWHDSDSEV